MTSTRKDGYVVLYAKGHPWAATKGGILEHRMIAQNALGKPLPPEAVVHHTDEQKGAIDPYGLVICPNERYHQLLHARSRALAACGNADWLKCSMCQKYDAPLNLYVNGNAHYHKECGAERFQAKQRLRSEEGRAMLMDIQSRFGHRKEFAPIVRAINTYLQPGRKEAA